VIMLHNVVDIAWCKRLLFYAHSHLVSAVSVFLYVAAPHLFLGVLLVKIMLLRMLFVS